MPGLRLDGENDAHVLGRPARSRECDVAGHQVRGLRLQIRQEACMSDDGPLDDETMKAIYYLGRSGRLVGEVKDAYVDGVIGDDALDRLIEWALQVEDEIGGHHSFTPATPRCMES